MRSHAYNEAVEKLRSDVLSVLEAFPSLKDGTILSAATSEHRILLTLDLDFGELIFRRGHPAVAGIVLIRTRLHSIDSVWRRLQTVIDELGESFAGQYVVVEDNRVRKRPLR